MDKRCDSQPDCFDKSDEFRCSKIDPDGSYQKFIPPPPTALGNRTTDKIIIKVSSDIIDILEMDEINSIFQVQFYLHFTWYDNRLTYFDLKDDIGLNTLSPEEKQKIWIPELIFDNTEFKLSTSLDADTVITISKQGQYTLSTMESPTKRKYFEGSKNPITLSRFYNTRFY